MIKATRNLCWLTALMLVGSCGKEAANVNHEYVGHWKSFTAGCEPWMRVPSNGEGFYRWGDTEKECRGMDHSGVPRISNGYLCIGSKRLKIDRAPYSAAPTVVSAWHLNNVEYTSTMRIELEGHVYYRLDGY